MTSKKITKHDVKLFLDSLPSGMKVPLKSDPLTLLLPEQIYEHIDNKTQIGKEYLLQIIKALSKRKQNKRSIADESGIILA